MAQVDFRTDALDAYDLTQVGADFNYRYRFKRRWAATGCFDFVDRIFKEGGTDQRVSVGGSMSFLLAPLYWLNLDLSVGKRSAADSVLGYSFHSYGLSVWAKI